MTIQRMGTVLAGLLLASLGMAAGFQTVSVADVDGARPVRFWCDTPGRVLALAVPTTAPGPGTLAQWAGGQRTLTPVQVGVDDPGAGQVYTPLGIPGQPAPADPGYFVHSSNIENAQDPAYRMTHVDGFRVPAGTFTCRYVPQAAVLAATAKHTVIVWDSGGRVTYASRNRDGTPGVQLTGGTHTRAGGREVYRWTQRGYTYSVSVGNPQLGQVPGGELRVSRGGAVLNTWLLQAYTLSTPR
ncbi:hypothetical protein [uncultured Deinococcus sp.]|uniref:hypothetical protein n=1 Tax=uncultured Deinococcus sp. TaxID=158789 RepID=UPI0025CEF15A|nr:hypothetical protein [uncultured Deinococcus sp.]